MEARFTGNLAARAGGGIEIVAGTVQITGAKVTNNDVTASGTLTTAAAPGNGGGLHVTGAATVTVNGGQFSSKKAAKEGGGLWNSATGTLFIRAYQGTGTVINSNIADGNGTEQGGGGVFNDGGT